MPRVALVEAKPSRNNYRTLFGDSFEFEHFRLTEDTDLAKVLARDVTLRLAIDDYDWIILIGSEPLKYFTKETSITNYSGKLIDDKFLPTINPAMLVFKPEATKSWEESRNNIINYISGKIEKPVINDENFVGIRDTETAIKYITAAIEHPGTYAAVDTETTALYPMNGFILGISLSYEVGKGAYIDTSCLDDICEKLLQQLFTKKKIIFHNAKFDIGMLNYHFGFVFPDFEDTMLQHYTLDETPGTHGLKELALKYSPWGDYERPMYEWIDEYRKINGLTMDQFRWEWIPFDTMKLYAAMDANVTLFMYEKFFKLLSVNAKLEKAYRDILLPSVGLLIDMQTNGVPFDKDRLLQCQQMLDQDLQDANTELRAFEEVKRFESVQNKHLNPNSVQQLRSLFFDYLGLEPTGKKTAKGADSTDAEVLESLATQHPIPAFILEIRRKIKIKSTYIDKILAGLDADGKLRTGFNTHMTTSGRLSSSGRLNMQQLPRENPMPKGCIKALPGRKIVVMDLTTAEMYIAAVLSGDVNLQEAFRAGQNFHSYIAKKVFKLPCTVEEVEDLYPLERQAAKAVSFGILYGAGPDKVASEVNSNGGNMSTTEAAAVIKEYFKNFKQLKKWIDGNKEFISSNAFIYSFFGRKRRVPDVRSGNRGLEGHAVRSALNFLIQSVASDINLLGAIEANDEIKIKGVDAKIFALVHDAILADVAEGDVEAYKEIIRSCVQRERGLSIVGVPIGCKFDEGDDYSLGKFEEYIKDRDATAKSNV